MEMANFSDTPKMQIILMLFLFLTVSKTYGAEACSIVSSKTLNNSAKDILKSANINVAKTNLPEMCKRNLILRYLNSRDKAPPNCELWPIEKLEEYADKSVSFIDPWNLSLISTRKTRQNSFDAFFDWRQSCSECADPYEFQNMEQVEVFFSKPRKTQMKPTDSLDRIKKIEMSDETPASQISLKDDITKTVFCVKESLFNSGTCVRGLNFLAEKTKVIQPRNFGKTFNNLDLWKKMYSTNNYDEGLRLAALKMMKRAKGDLSVSANAFDDLQESFLATGLSKEESREAAIDTMGLISNGGPNTLPRAVKIGSEYSQKSVALGFIAIAITYIDSKKQIENGNLYSYPSNVKATCDNAKPYHFWMAAYLAKELKKNNFSEEDSTSIVYLANQGYHLKRDIGYVQRNADGTPSKMGPTKNAILTRDPFDPAHQIVRTDLAYAAAGAVFGAKNDKKEIDVDKAIVDLLKDSSVEPTLPKQQATQLSLVESYYYWSKIFSPATALKSIRGN